MQTGDTINVPLGRMTVAGQPAPGLSSSSFLVSAYQGGVALSLTTVITYIGTAGNFAIYNAAITLPSSTGIIWLVTQTTGGSLDFLTNNSLTIDLESYDDDAVAALMLMAQGTPAVLSAADSSLGDIVDGDSYQSATLTMPAGKLSPFGITDVGAAGIAVEAAIMLSPGGPSYPITATVVSGVGLTFTIGWTTQQHPALTTQNAVPCYIDVQVIKTGPPKIVVTTNRYSFNEVWQRDTRTS